MPDALRPVDRARRGGFLRPRRRRRRIVVALLLTAAVVGASGYVAWGRWHSGPDAARYGLRKIPFDLHSALLHRTLRELAIEPPPLSDGRRRPLLVFLHGRGGSAVSQATEAFLAAIRAAGAQAPDVVFADGGDHSYYHDRADGPWGSYVVREVIPQAIRLLHADPKRVAIGGISMGGFGALDIARLWPGRFCAVGGHSAALYPTAGDTAAGAFDDAEDFARHDVLAAVQGHNPYRGVRVWIDVGTGDPFRQTDTEFAHALRAAGGHVAFHVWSGGHNSAYWAAHVRRYIAFYASALASCP